MNVNDTHSRTSGRWIIAQFKKGGLSASLALIIPLLSGVLLVFQSYALARIIHRAVIEQAPVSEVFFLVLWVGGLMAARAVLTAISDALAAHVSETIKAGLRRTVLRDMLSRAPTWTASRSSGALSSLVVEQIESLDGFFARYMPAMVQASILPLAFAAIAIPLDWVIAILFFITIPLIPIFMALVGWGAEEATNAQADALNRLSGRFADRLRGMVTLKLFNRVSAETDNIHEASEALRVRTMKVMRIAFLSSAVLELFAALGVAGVALYVGLTYLDLINVRGGAELSLQVGLFCLLMAPEIYQPLRQLAANYHDRASAKSAAAEIEAAIGYLPDEHAERTTIAEWLPTERIQTSPARVELQGVSIKSPVGAEVLNEASLTVAPGEKIAILGPSGIGKSTLIEAIARLRDYEGTILLDGTDLTSIGETQLRNDLAVLGQRPRIFSGSIADNIRIARPGACDTSVQQAAERAQVTKFANKLADGLDTVIGDNGYGLSGGEAQRIALARIYLRDPRVLILDEPTAHLDGDTEQEVIDGLLSFATDRTLIVVTHARSVAARMERSYRIAGKAIYDAPHATTKKNDGGRGVA